MTIRKAVWGLFLYLLLYSFNNIYCYSTSHEQSVLVTTQWLDQNLLNENLIILHIGQRESYEKEHIPNAKLISMRSLIIENENLSHEFPSVQVMDSIFSSLGISSNSNIVITYENDMMIPVAARLYLTLDYSGLGNKSSILDGGFPKWMEEGRKLSDEIPKSVKTNFSSNINDNILVDVHWMTENLLNPDIVIIDSRPE